MIYIPYLKPAGPTYTGDVILHCHFDGADGDTSWPDFSPFARTITGSNTMKLSTAQAKFGTASLCWTHNNATGWTSGFTADYGYAANEPYTIAYWCYHVTTFAVTASPGILEWRDAVSQREYVGNYGTGCRPEYDTSIPGDDYLPGTTESSNVWHHIALAFDGTTLRFFVNGVERDSTVYSRGVAVTGQIRLGVHSGAGEIVDNGHEFYIDELFVIKGQCLYTANFTPPTTPY